MIALAELVVEVLVHVTYMHLQSTLVSLSVDIYNGDIY